MHPGQHVCPIAHQHRGFALHHARAVRGLDARVRHVDIAGQGLQERAGKPIAGRRRSDQRGRDDFDRAIGAARPRHERRVERAIGNRHARRATGAHRRVHLAGPRDEHPSAIHENGRLDLGRQWRGDPHGLSGQRPRYQRTVGGRELGSTPQRPRHLTHPLRNPTRPVLPLLGRPRHPVTFDGFEGRCLAGAHEAGHHQRGRGKAGEQARAAHQRYE